MLCNESIYIEYSERGGNLLLLLYFQFFTSFAVLHFLVTRRGIIGYLASQFVDLILFFLFYFILVTLPIELVLFLFDCFLCEKWLVEKFTWSFCIRSGGTSFLGGLWCTLQGGRLCNMSISLWLSRITMDSYLYFVFKHLRNLRRAEIIIMINAVRRKPSQRVFWRRRNI